MFMPVQWHHCTVAVKYTQAQIDVFPLNAIWCHSSGSCLFLRNAHLWRATQRILCMAAQQTMWYLPKVFCQGAIIRFKGHPPSHNPETLPNNLRPLLSASTDGWTSLLASQLKEQWSVSHDVMFILEGAWPWERLGLFHAEERNVFLVWNIEKLLNVHCILGSNSKLTLP